MPKQINEWLDKRHEVLWKKFQGNDVTGDEIKKVLMDIGKVDENSVPVIISELKKKGLIETKLDPNDSRKRIYKIKPMQDILKDALNLGGEGLTRGDIYTILKKAADLIRTRVDYKFILILLFLKRISDKWQDEREKAIKELIKDGLTEKEAEKEAKKSAYHEFDLPEEYLWDNLRNEVNELPEKFSKALKTLAELNPELKDVLDNADFIQFTQNIENSEILRQLVELFSEKKLNHVSPDILGDAYEWILRYFAPDKAKEGEVYTPREVIRLIVEILKPEPGKSIYDPTSASNGMLIVAHKYVEEKYGKKEAEKLFLYGQEANHKTLALGRMNMYIHNIRNVQLAFGDTLLYPKFKEQDNLKQFDYIISNPPWNQDGYDETVLKKGEFLKRFNYGFVSKQSADWAWVQHMIASAKDKTGKIGIILDTGALFRGGKEKGIREQILKDDLIECIILLPEKLFYNTGAPGVILILNKNKSQERKNKILFINASETFEKHPEVRKLNIISDKHIKKIVESYNNFKEDFNFARIRTREEIIDENNSDLNVNIHCPIINHVKTIVIDEEINRDKKLNEILLGIDEKIDLYLKKIHDSDIEDLIKKGEWMELTLKDIAEDIIMGQSPPGESYNREGKGIPLLNGAADLTERGIKINQFTTQPTKIAKTGDLIFCIRATIGNIQKADKDYCLGRGVAAVRADIKIITNELLFFILENNFGYLERISAGSTIKGIKKDDLEDMKLRFPRDTEEQKEMTKILELAKEKLKIQEERYNKSIEIKKGLMDDMLNGKKRVDIKRVLGKHRERDNDQTS